SFGQFTFTLNGTYVFDYKQTTFDGTQVINYAGKRGPLDGAIARWRDYAQLNWTNGPWGATLANTYQSAYGEPDPTTCDDKGLNCGERRVGSYSIWDLQGRYTGIKNTTLTLGIRNLADTRPPVSNQSYDFQVGYDPTYADPRGRTYYGSIRYAFR
ncbi:MAG TPA: TonB-dependent receptor, partial [Casimicrobiaceae bacterium]